MLQRRLYEEKNIQPQMSKTLYSAHIDTPLGKMIAISDEKALYLLDYLDSSSLPDKIALLKREVHAKVVPGTTDIIFSIHKELSLYFSGRLYEFQTPIALHGTPFQNHVWHAARTICHGSTMSYGDLACGINNAKAVQAVAQALRSNRLLLIVPCHRVIKGTGELSGYSGGVSRKSWLLDHEENCM